MLFPDFRLCIASPIKYIGLIQNACGDRPVSKSPLPECRQPLPSPSSFAFRQEGAGGAPTPPALQRPVATRFQTHTFNCHWLSLRSNNRQVCPSIITTCRLSLACASPVPPGLLAVSDSHVIRELLRNTTPPHSTSFLGYAYGLTTFLPREIPKPVGYSKCASSCPDCPCG